MNTSSAAANASATPAVRWSVIKYEERRPINLGAGASHPNLATCQKCGQCIKYVVTLKSTDGDVIQVGRDCAITMEGGPELAEIRRAEREAAHQEWLASDEGRAHTEAARNADSRRAALAASNAERFALWIAGLRLVIACSKAGQWTRDICKATLQAWESGHRDAPLSMAEERLFFSAMRDVLLPESTYHPKDVKSRVTLDVWFEYRTHFIGDNFRGDETIKYVWNLRDSEGRRYVWITESWLGDLHKDADKGVRLKVKATIKSVKEYNGRKQTSLSRVTVLETEGGDRDARRKADGFQD